MAGVNGFASGLRRGAAWLFLARFGAHGLGLVFTVIAARRFAPADFGQFTFFASLLLIGNTFTTFGTDTLLLRETARLGLLPELSQRTFTLQVLLSGVWWLGAAGLRAEPALLVLLLALFPLALISVYSALFRALNRMDLFWALNFVNGGTQVVAVVLARDIFTLCAYFTVGQALGAVVAIGLYSASLPRLRLLPFLDVRPLLRLTLPFAALSTLGMLSQRLSILTVTVWLGASAAGLLSTSTRILEALKLGHYALLGAWLPSLARGLPDAAQTSRRVLLSLLAGSFALALAVTWLAQPLLALLFGAKYLSAVGLLRVVVWCLVPYTVSAFLSVEFVVQGYEARLAIVIAISLAASLVLYSLLVERFGLQGATLAMLAAELLQAFLMVCFRFTIRRHHDRPH